MYNVNTQLSPYASCRLQEQMMAQSSKKVTFKEDSEIMGATGAPPPKAAPTGAAPLNPKPKPATGLRRMSLFDRGGMRRSRALHGGTHYRSSSGPRRPSVPTRHPIKCATQCFHWTRNQRDPLIDNISKIIFPSAFVIFNIAYWCYYLL